MDKLDLPVPGRVPGYLGYPEADIFCHEGLDLRSGIPQPGHGAPCAGKLDYQNPLLPFLEPLDVSPQLPRPHGDFEAESNGNGLDLVGPSGHDGVGVRLCKVEEVELDAVEAFKNERVGSFRAGMVPVSMMSWVVAPYGDTDRPRPPRAERA